MTSTEKAVEAIYAASLAPAGWNDVVAEIGGLFDTATGTFYLDRDGPFGTQADVVASFGHSASALGAYQEYYASVNPFDRDPSRFGVGDAVTDEELDRRLRVAGAFENSEYYNDWVRPQHLRHVLGCYLDRSETGTLVAAFWRPGDVGAYSKDEADAFGRLMRHAMRSIEIGARLRTAEAEMQAMLGRSATAIFTLGRNGLVRQCNAVADRLLGVGCALRLRDGRLVAAVAQDQPVLDRLIACAFDSRRVAWAENARVAIRRTDGGLPLAARISAAGCRLESFAPDRAASAVLTVEGFEGTGAPSAEGLRRRFALTPAQTRIAVALGSGKTLRQAPGELGIGLETARSHLKAVFARTDTHRQAELVLLLRGLEQR